MFNWECSKFVFRDAISTESGNCQGGGGKCKGERSCSCYYCNFRWHTMRRCLCILFLLLSGKRCVLGWLAYINCNKLFFLDSTHQQMVVSSFEDILSDFS